MSAFNGKRIRRFDLATPQKRGSSIGPMTHFYEVDSKTRRAERKGTA